MERSSADDNAFQENFSKQFTADADCPQCWIFMGTKHSLNHPGHIVDVYQNFVTGHWEERNLRKDFK